MQDFKTSFQTSKTPMEVYNTINDVRTWWLGEIEGDSKQVGDEFTYRYRDLHFTRHRVSELIPGKRIVWDVTDAKLTFVEKQTEWIGTRVIFEISEGNGIATVNFTHEGLKPELQCFEGCSRGWTHYIYGVLPNLLENGTTEIKK